MAESKLSGAFNRLLQTVARVAPGATTWRVKLHRWRGVGIGEECWIGYDVILETSRPHLIRMGNRVTISVRAMLIAHFRGAEGITIEDDVFVGPGAILLPNITVGKGAVVSAGSVVSSSVAPMTLVQGNPARPIARCGVILAHDTPVAAFYRSLRPFKKKGT